MMDVWEGYFFSQIVRKPDVLADKMAVKGREEVYETHLLVEFPAIVGEEPERSIEDEDMELPERVSDYSRLRTALYKEYATYFFKDL